MSKIKTLQNLPEGYKELFRVDLQNDKKLALKINLLSLAIMLIMAVGMNFAVPITTLFDFDNGFSSFFIRWAVQIISMIAYIILHEAVHGITMKYFGCKKVNFGFTGLYAFAGSQEYFKKKPYLIIALAPVVFWGIVLLIINIFVPSEWFWIVYIIQCINISGAAGDIYVTWKFMHLPDDIFIKDTGVSMTVYGQ